MATQYTEEIKNDAVRYWKEHPELGIAKCAKNLGISKTALSNWRKIYDANEGTVPTRGRGNFESDDAKELARLRKELRDTQDALDILKKAIGILGKLQRLSSWRLPGMKSSFWKRRNAGRMFLVC